MAAPTLAVIEAVDSAQADVAPISAAVHITLTGDKFFSGNAAFNKAEELRKLAEALDSRGIPKAALSLAGATVDVSSGMFTKSSSVTYRVRVMVEDLDLLGSVLDVISEAKKASLTRLAWNYDDHGSEERQLFAAHVFVRRLWHEFRPLTGVTLAPRLCLLLGGGWRDRARLARPDASFADHLSRALGACLLVLGAERFQQLVEQARLRA